MFVKIKVKFIFMKREYWVIIKAEINLRQNGEKSPNKLTLYAWAVFSFLSKPTMILLKPADPSKVHYARGVTYLFPILWPRINQLNRNCRRGDPDKSEKHTVVQAQFSQTEHVNHVFKEDGKFKLRMDRNKIN